MKNAFQTARFGKNNEVPAPVAVQQPVPVFVVTKEPKKDKWGRAYGTGRRKNSTARVWISPRKGPQATFTVNGRAIDVYFARSVLRMIINQPFAATNTEGLFDVMCTVKGGGLSGQAGAVRHGIARALDNYDPVAYHNRLHKGKFLTRDSRAVERKKAGRKKARKLPQFSKR